MHLAQHLADPEIEFHELEQLQIDEEMRQCFAVFLWFLEGIEPQAVKQHELITFFCTKFKDRCLASRSGSSSTCTATRVIVDESEVFGVLLSWVIPCDLCLARVI